MQSLADASTRPPLPLPRRRSDLRPGERNVLVALVAAAHLLALWGLLQISAVQDAVREVAPMVVDFITIEQPPKVEPPPPPPPRPQPRPRPTPQPVIAAPPAPAPEAPAPFVVPPPPPEPVSRPLETTLPAPTLPPAPPTPPAPPAAPRLIPAGNVSYLVPPPIEVPLASRRMGEQGTVTLRVTVGTDGLPKSVVVQRSSGHARLDEQAVWAMKRARFKPQTDNGVPIEWIVLAPLQYEIE